MTALMTAFGEAPGSRQAFDAQAIAPTEFRRAMRTFVTGVTIVTTLADDGRMVGMTANSFTSVSLDPPLVLVCLSDRARSYQAFLRAGRLAIHILADDQAELARAFAGHGTERGSICPWHVNGRGYPILDRYLAVLECRIADVYKAGDHAIVVGRVEALDGPRAGTSPLVFHDGRMFGLGAGRP
jgi:3-hydroxy-9,10-secoandrosta-1,3,5(10)-triene-9,17-dione monooxygenase reductase component